MTEIVSGDERKEYEEELEYQDSIKNTIKVPSQEEEVAARRNRAKNPTAYESSRDYESPATDEEEVDYYEKTRGNKERDDYKQRKFEEEQEAWNRKYKSDVKAREYEEEQKRIVASKKVPSFGEKAKTKLGEAAGTGWNRLKKNLSAPVQRAEDIREKNTAGKSNNLTKADVAKMIRAGKAKPTKGQFASPRYGGGFGGGGKVSGSFPDIDPFGGMGGRGRNMLDLGFGGLGVAPQRQQPQAPVRKAPPRPKPTPMKFPDPFAGLKGGRKEMPEKIIGRGLGIGTGKKSAKKLKRMDDWMNF